MKKFSALFITLALIFSVSGCTNSFNHTADNNQANTTETTEESFDVLTDYEFILSSGAGGWYTSITIDADGHFKGSYHDSEMGLTGDGYENGTIYFSDFEGGFGNLEKTDEFSYKTSLDSISYTHEPESEEIQDSIKYIYSTAFGLMDTDSFVIYLPGTSISNLSEDIYPWIQNGINEDKLTAPIIVNVDQQYAFCGYHIEAAE